MSNCGIDPDTISFSSVLSGELETIKYPQISTLKSIFLSSQRFERLGFRASALGPNETIRSSYEMKLEP